MTIWELLATTESRVLTWQPATWASLPEGTRQIYWGNEEGSHAASAAFDSEGEVLILELTHPPKIWINPRVRDSWLGELAAAPPPEIRDNNAALRLFLETVR